MLILILDEIKFISILPSFLLREHMMENMFLLSIKMVMFDLHQIQIPLSLQLVFLDEIFSLHYEMELFLMRDLLLDKDELLDQLEPIEPMG